MQLTPQTAVLGYMDAEDKKLQLLNHILLLLKSFSMTQEQQNA